MAIQVTMSPPDAGARVLALARLFPQEMRMALGRAGAAYRGRLRQVMSHAGGIWGVPSFAALSPLSLSLRQRRIVGGKLADPSSIQMYSNGGILAIGWITALQPWASMLQEHGDRETTPSERHYLYMRTGSQESHRAAKLQQADAYKHEATSLYAAARRRAKSKGSRVDLAELRANPGKYAWMMATGSITRKIGQMRAAQMRRNAEELKVAAKGARNEAKHLTGERAFVQDHYHRPARPVIEPFAEAHRTEFPRWIEGAGSKLIARRLERIASVTPRFQEPNP